MQMSDKAVAEQRGLRRSPKKGKQKFYACFSVLVVVQGQKRCKITENFNAGQIINTFYTFFLFLCILLAIHAKIQVVQNEYSE